MKIDLERRFHTGVRSGFKPQGHPILRSAPFFGSDRSDRVHLVRRGTLHYRSHERGKWWWNDSITVTYWCSAFGFSSKGYFLHDVPEGRHVCPLCQARFDRMARRRRGLASA